VMKRETLVDALSCCSHVGGHRWVRWSTWNLHFLVTVLRSLILSFLGSLLLQIYKFKLPTYLIYLY
jgi:hypothetical protein